MKHYFSDTHEWIAQTGDGEWLIGISHYAQMQLGDVIFVELPAIGASISCGGSFAVVESVKAANEIYAPVNGTVTAVNERLEAEPELVNKSPQEHGWLIRIRAEPNLNLLKDAQAYENFCENQ